MADIAAATWQIPVAIAGGTWLIGVSRGVRQRWLWYARFVGVLGLLLLAGAGAKVAGVSYDSSAPSAPAFAVLGVLGVWTGVLLWRDAEQQPTGAVPR